MRKNLQGYLLAFGLLLGIQAGAMAQSLPQKNWVLQSPIISLGYCQQTSVSTAVTCSASSGVITTFSQSAAAGAVSTFTVR